MDQVITLSRRTPPVPPAASSLATGASALSARQYPICTPRFHFGGHENPGVHSVVPLSSLRRALGRALCATAVPQPRVTDLLADATVPVIITGGVV